MTMRKFAALFLTIAMLVSAVGTTVLAADTVGFELKLSKDNVYVGDDFTVDLYVTLPASVTTLRQVQIDFTYNNEAMKLVKAADKTADAVKVEQAVTVTDAIPADYMLIYGQSKTASSVSYSVGYDYSIEQTGTFSNMTSGKIYSFTFVALAEGEMNIDATAFTWQYGAGDTDKYTLADSSATDSTASGLKVQVMPIAPTATINTPAFTGEVVEGGEGVKPSYVWNNGNQGTGAVTNNGDASVVTWYANDDKIGETVADAAFVIPATAVGKTLSYTILPKVERTLVPEGTLSAKTTVGMVKAIASYLPTVETATLPAELIATKSYAPEVTLDGTYELATDVSTYKWYVVEADSVEAALAATLGDALYETKEASFGPEYRDKYAVVEVTPVVTIAGDTRTGTETKKAAALIKGEPPVLADDAEAEIAKLAAKKFFTSSTPDATSVEFVSKVDPEVGTDVINYSYAWYLTSELKTADTFVADEATAIVAEDALKTAGKVKLSKVEGAEGKYLVVVITAKDYLNIESSTTVFFQNAIKKATGGSGTQGGASLVTGNNGAVVEPEKPGTDEPAVDEKNPQDPAGEANDKGATVFTDVDKEVYAWGYDYLDKLAKAGVVKGMTETTYAPEEETTYAQFTALVVRVLGLTAEEAATEKVAADHWSFAEVSVADKLGLLADVAFDADKAITREDMAAIAHKALVAKAVELKAGEAVEYSDASAISEYAAAAIDAMSKAGILNGMGDGTFAPKGTTTRMQTAKVIGMISELIG